MADTSNESTVPEGCAALIFNADGTYELWLPNVMMADGNDMPVDVGYQLAAAIATRLAADPKFAQDLIDELNETAAFAEAEEDEENEQ